MTHLQQAKHYLHKMKDAVSYEEAARNRKMVLLYTQCSFDAREINAQTRDIILTKALEHLNKYEPA